MCNLYFADRYFETPCVSHTDGGECDVIIVIVLEMIDGKHSVVLQGTIETHIHLEKVPLIL